jgi:hypothetical protein
MKYLLKKEKFTVEQIRCWEEWWQIAFAFAYLLFLLPLPLISFLLVWFKARAKNKSPSVRIVIFTWQGPFTENLWWFESVYMAKRCLLVSVSTVIFFCLAKLDSCVIFTVHTGFSVCPQCNDMYAAGNVLCTPGACETI